MSLRSALALTLTAALLLLNAGCRAGTLNTPYTDPAQFTRIPFGSHSHWAQPWRAYLETVPATTFLNGTGVNLNLNGQNPALVAEMLARHGIRHVRIEIGWGSLAYADESQITNALALGASLRACRRFHLRPLVLLNANQGVPCPTRFFSHKLLADARTGDTQIQLDDTSDLIVDHSGLSNLSGYWAAEDLVTQVRGQTVTLSKPLLKDIPAGTAVPMATLKYRPFGDPKSLDDQDTIAGWQKYVGTVARFVSYLLGTTNSADKGFDMEIWNELTFGSEFLYINHYYAKPPSKYDENGVWSRLVAATAAYADAHPADFQGVQFGDGFANTIPWPSSSAEPARIGAVDKHPYAGRNSFPKGNYQGVTLNALYQPDPFVPTYSELFPEYFASALQTEMLEREMAPITTDIFGARHGRAARVASGKVVPCSTWVTEVNIAPGDDDHDITHERALAVKAKAIARYFCFYLNKGVTQLDLYGAVGGDKSLGVVQDNFLEYAQQPDAIYPPDDTLVTSPALAAVGRIAAQMRRGLGDTLSRTRPLEILSLSDAHDHFQFRGDGTPAHPTLYDRDVFAFLPYQVNPHRFVIPYYVMTRDVMRDLPAEAFTVKIGGIHALGATVTAYDPLRDQPVPVTVTARQTNAVTLKLPASDYPYLLLIQEAQKN